MNSTMNDCAVYIRIMPNDPHNYIWIYRRADHWLVERGHDFNTWITSFHIDTDNDLHEYLSKTLPAPLDEDQYDDDDDDDD
jgi:hypothetical protein